MADTRSLMVTSVAQVPTALVLGVTDAELAFRPHVLLSRCVEWGSVTFQFSIIGESHFVRIERDGKLWFQELLACTPLLNLSVGHIHPFDKLLAHDYAKESYRIRVTFSQSPPRRLNNGNGIIVRFPRQHGITPLTHISWRLHANHIDWWTLHTYPEATHTTYVLSESRLGKPESTSR
jgi:hypothetical protein